MTKDAGYRFDRYQPDEKHWYIPAPELKVAVNTALAAEQPLLLTGEPGTGKSTLARSVAEVLDLGEVLTFHTRSDVQAMDCLYRFDALKRLYDAQIENPEVTNAKNYVYPHALGIAIAEKKTRVVLIDEIDKAPRDFPNDLLNVIEAMEYEVRETGTNHRAPASARPIVFITSNSEKALPDAFLRRCVFHHIRFPTKEQLQRIVASSPAHGALEKEHAERAIERFENLRDAALDKKPATAELLVWLRVLQRAGRLSEAASAPWDEIFVRTLLKTQADLEIVLRDPKLGAEPSR